MDEKTASLQVIKLDYIDHIPYLMHTMDIDSVFEIVTYGRYSSANERDTLNCYVSRGNNTISQNHNSFMCCYDTYQYDSIGILSKRSMLSCYTTEFDLNHERENNTITATETGTYNDSYIHIYTLENERIINKMSTHNIDEDYSEKVKYFYNSKRQLIKRHSEAKNAPNNEFDYRVMLKAYSWQGNMLKEANLKQFYNNGQEFYETKTTFDAFGFPASRTIMNNKDTICKTILIKINTPRQ